MGLHNIDLKVNFNPQTKRAKRLNLEKLSRPVANFVKHINFVLSGTTYGVYQVINKRYKPSKILSKIVDEMNFLEVDVILYRLGEPAEVALDGLGELTDVALDRLGEESTEVRLYKLGEEPIDIALDELRGEPIDAHEKGLGYVHIRLDNGIVEDKIEFIKSKNPKNIMAYEEKIKDYDLSEMKKMLN
jgi:hypothetical protein